MEVLRPVGQRRQDVVERLARRLPRLRFLAGCCGSSPSVKFVISDGVSKGLAGGTFFSNISDPSRFPDPFTLRALTLFRFAV